MWEIVSSEGLRHRCPPQIVGMEERKKRRIKRFIFDLYKKKF